MRLLLDTHTLVWWFGRSPRLPARVHALISETTRDRFVSAATIWEIAIKANKGNFREGGDLLAQMEDQLSHVKLMTLPITHIHARHAGALASHHGDPFDRMLAAQAELEDLTLVSIDGVFDRYNVERIW